MQRTTALALFSILTAACAADAGEPARSAAEGTLLEAVCVSDDAAVPPDAFRCDEPRLVECEGDGVAWEDRIHVIGERCGGPTPRISDRGPFTLGTHRVAVESALEELCSTTVTVVDTEPPEVVTRYEPILWPDDDRMHPITPRDCVEVEDACSPESHAFFTWVSSDEPLDARGPRDFVPADAVAKGCDAVYLRAERDPDGDGRVYRLGWRAVDALGHSVDGVCRVSVPPYPGSEPAVHSGEAYRTDLGCTR